MVRQLRVSQDLGQCAWLIDIPGTLYFRLTEV